MKLVSLTIKNFRSYANKTVIKFDDLTTIIGKNDIGKSTIMEALEIFFNNETVKIDSTDKNVWSNSQDIEIACEFTDLPDKIIIDVKSHTTLQDEYLLSKDNTLHILKRFSTKTSKPKESVFALALHPSKEHYSDLLELTNAKLKQRLIKLNINTTDVSQNINNLMRKAIWDSCDDLQLEEREVPLNGDETKQIWDVLKSRLPQFALYQSDRASKDSDSEVQDPLKTAIDHILASPEIQIKLQEIVDIIQQTATNIAQETHSVLKMLNKDLASQLVPEFKNDPKWSSLFSLTLRDENFIPVNKKGSGVRRMILISFLIAEANRRKSIDQRNNIIYAIEEPETSQHPHFQKLLLNALYSISNRVGCQIVLTTHSPGLTSMLPLNSFRYIKKNTDGLNEILENGDTMYKEIVEELGIVPDNRVKLLICVEGPTDVHALKILSSALNKDDSTIIDLSSDPRVAFVPLGGGTLNFWVEKNYLGNLNRPEFHLYDGDKDSYIIEIEKVKARNDKSTGIVTKRLMMENYLHPKAIQDGLGISIQVNGSDNIVKKIKDDLSNPYGRESTIKKLLSQHAFPLMTGELIRESDPDGEIESWFRTIAKMIDDTI